MACVPAGNKEDEFRMPYLSHQQLPAGILPMVPEVAQAVGVSQGHHTKDFARAAPNPAKATVTAMIARELLYGGTSPTAETILKSNISSGHVPHGPRTRPSEQLYYLSRAQGFQVTVGFRVVTFVPQMTLTVWSGQVLSAELPVECVQDPACVLLSAPQKLEKVFVIVHEFECTVWFCARRSRMRRWLIM